MNNNEMLSIIFHNNIVAVILQLLRGVSLREIAQIDSKQ